MTIPAAVTLLSKQYPHCAELLRAFAPLLEARVSLVSSLPAPSPLPSLDHGLFAQGKAWLMPDREHLGLYLDNAFLHAAPRALAEAAGTGFPELKDALLALAALLSENPRACRHLASLGLQGKPHRIPHWARKHGQHVQAANLLGTHMAGAAARRVAAAAPSLPAWEQGHCPVCGGMPHAGVLRHKEGQRFLQCALCGHQWRFSRTVCPVCDDTAPEKRQVFFIEGDSAARAEGCDACKTYLLVPDIRAHLEDCPLELLLLCLMPLDMLMQEKGYTPAALAAQGTASDRVQNKE